MLDKHVKIYRMYFTLFKCLVISSINSICCVIGEITYIILCSLSNSLDAPVSLLADGNDKSSKSNSSAKINTAKV